MGHHYDMSASGSAGGGGGCFGGGGFLPADDRQHPFYHSSSVAMLDRAFFDDDDDDDENDENDENFSLNANDMPFAVDGMNHTAYIFPKNDTNSLHPPSCPDGGATTGDASLSVYSIRNGYKCLTRRRLRRIITTIMIQYSLHATIVLPTAEVVQILQLLYRCQESSHSPKNWPILNRSVQA